MSNQTAATIGAIANAVNWEKEGLDLQSIIEAANQGRLGGPLTSWLVTRAWNIAEEVKTYLKKLFEVEIGATDGKDTYETASKVFPADFDPDFKNWGIVFDGVAPKTTIVAFELVQKGKFSDFLGNTAVELEKRRILGSQWLAICRNNSDKLRDDNRANFAILTRNDEQVKEDLSNVFVAGVSVCDVGQLHAVLLGFSSDHEEKFILDQNVWHGDNEHRVFYPQQKLCC